MNKEITRASSPFVFKSSVTKNECNMAKRLTTEEFIRKAREVHGDKYDYSKVDYKTNKDKVCIICPIHGEFWQRPDCHIAQKQGCRLCGNAQRADEERHTTEMFIRKATSIHGGKYDYSKVEYVDNKTKVCIICPVHGEFWMRPDCHLWGRKGCRLCRSDNMKKALFGVGVFDDYNKRCECYNYWTNMLRRCYDEDWHKKAPCYSDCFVCKEWLTYSAFKRWFEQNYIEGWHLDKDILVKGNREYAPDKCCFVPPEINSVFRSNVATSHKVKRSRELAEKYKCQLETRVYERLCHYGEEE